MNRNLVAGIGICWLCIAAGCTVVDSNPGDSLAVGWGVVELRGETQLVRAVSRTLIPDARANQVVKLDFGDGRELVLSLQSLKKGLHQIGHSGDRETGAIFTEPRKLWTGDRGYIETDRAANGALTGYFHIEFFDSVSSCYRCEGTILTVDGKFHAIDE